MKMKIRPAGLLLILLLSVNYACVLQHEEPNFVHVEQVADPKYIATLTYSFGGNRYYPMKDTFWLPGTESLGLRFSDNRVFKVEAKIDGKAIAAIGNPFYIDPKKFTPGTYPLEITQFVKSGTKSLADNLGTETAAYTATFVIIIGSEPTYKPKIESLQPKNGTINLQWNAYPHSDFQAYKIRKYETWSGTYQTYRELVITDPSQTSFNDTTYTGGWITYVLAVDKGGRIVASPDYRVNFQYKPNMKLTKLGAGRTRLSWDLPPYYKNIKSIKVSRTNINPSVPIAEITGDQTSADINDFEPPFGLLHEFTLSMTAKVDNPNQAGDKFSVSQQISYGKRTPPFGDVVYNQAEGAYYMIFFTDYYNEYPEGIYRLDQDLNITDTLRYSGYSSDYANLIRSPDGKYVYLLNNGSIITLNKKPLSIAQSYPAGTSFSIATTDHAAVTNNNLLLYQQDTKLIILDFATKIKLVNVTAATAWHISPNGEYFANGADLYQFDGSQFQLIAALPYGNIRYLYFLNGGDRLLIATPDKVIVYDHHNSQSLAEYSFTTPDSGRPRFNDLTMRYSVRNNGITSLNTDTGEQRTDQLYQNNGAIEGEYLFSRTGSALKILNDE